MKILFLFIYTIIGLIVSYIDWKYYYAEEYNESPEEYEDGMVSIYYSFATFFWPVFVLKWIYAWIKSK